MPQTSLKTTARQLRAHLATDFDRLRGYPALRQRFREINGFDLDLKNPKSFNEKIQWRKVYDRNPLFPILMDKVRMADWARSVLPTQDHQYLPEFLQVVDDADEIDFSVLPADLALKCNHASGWNVILREGEEFDADQVRRRLNRWLGRKFGKDPSRHETGYHAIPPRVGVQALLLNEDGSLADDVRFHIFGEKFGFGHIGSGVRPHGRHVTFFDANYTTLNVRVNCSRHDPPKAKPKGFEDMLRIAHILARHLDYMRVDFLRAGDRFFLNEITLYHLSGFQTLKPLAFEYEMGALWQLPDR